MHGRPEQLSVQYSPYLAISAVCIGMPATARTRRGPERVPSLTSPLCLNGIPTSIGIAARTRIATHLSIRTQARGLAAADGEYGQEQERDPLGRQKQGCYHEECELEVENKRRYGLCCVALCVLAVSG